RLACYTLDVRQAAPLPGISDKDLSVEWMELTREQTAGLSSAKAPGVRARVVFAEIDQSAVAARRADWMGDITTCQDAPAGPGLPHDSAGRIIAHYTRTELGCKCRESRWICRVLEAERPCDLSARDRSMVVAEVVRIGECSMAAAVDCHEWVTGAGQEMKARI